MSEALRNLVERLRRWASPVQQFITAFVIISSIGGYFAHNNYGDNHGAIAVSTTTMQFGTSSMLDSRNKARKEAMAACREEVDGVKPDDCKIGVWFYDACGALALDRAARTVDNAWGAAWAGTQQVAEEKAMENCRRHSRSGKCSIADSYCSI